MKNYKFLGRLFVKIQNDHNSLFSLPPKRKKERNCFYIFGGRERGERDGDSSALKCADYGNKWSDKRVE
jgi:hypothetical protein